MCLAVLFYKHFDDCPLALAANREEAYDRPTHPPHWWGSPPLFAGQDRRAGGTWLGVNRAGLLVALTNRVTGSESTLPPAPQPRSRGQLCVDALRRPSADEALSWTRSHLDVEAYNPFNLLLADHASAWVVHFDGTIRVSQLTPGIHYLAETGLDDPSHPRIAGARMLIEDGIAETWTSSLPALRQTMATHQGDMDPTARMCRHLGRFGTVSSTLVGLPSSRLEQATYEHAPGPPCSQPFEDLSHRLREGLG